MFKAAFWFKALFGVRLFVWFKACLFGLKLLGLRFKASGAEGSGGQVVGQCF